MIPKISVSLTEKDLRALDRFVRETGLPSRSAGVQQAIRRLGDDELRAAYAAAWDEWAESGDGAAWEAVSGDGLADAPR